MKQKVNVRKMVLCAIFASLAFVPNTFVYFPAMAPFQHTVIAISGRIDVISDGKSTCVLRNGCATMARITGSGCMLTALIGAFCGSNTDPFPAACAAMAAMGISGEIAEEKRLRNHTGNATLRNDLIDAVFNLTEEQLEKGVHYEIYKR